MKPWQDPKHPSNNIRPLVRCCNCRAKGCVTYWGPWCFDCNVKRMTRLSAQFDALAESLKERHDADQK